jgi:hypothetical protein
VSWGDGGFGSWDLFVICDLCLAEPGVRHRPLRRLFRVWASISEALARFQFKSASRRAWQDLVAGSDDIPTRSASEVRSAVPRWRFGFSAVLRWRFGLVCTRRESPDRRAIAPASCRQPCARCRPGPAAIRRVPGVPWLMPRARGGRAVDLCSTTSCFPARVGVSNLCLRSQVANLRRSAPPPRANATRGTCRVAQSVPGVERVQAGLQDALKLNLAGVNAKEGGVASAGLVRCPGPACDLACHSLRPSRVARCPTFCSAEQNPLLSAPRCSWDAADAPGNAAHPQPRCLSSREAHFTHRAA